ncbi:MAG: type II toxin-antitoxin system PemK/MazF family toxin [Chloroflexota bacterium]|nr:type II toxin-antitoxin system PemK/MazF family toxin [Chloroflexota bacterium]
MTFESFDVVVVPFPFSDRGTVKRRPALTISSADFNRNHRQLILAMITSTGSGWPSDVVIADWQDAGLNVPCRIRFKLFTLDDALIIRRLGRLTKRDADAAHNALGVVLASSG